MYDDNTEFSFPRGVKLTWKQLRGLDDLSADDISKVRNIEEQSVLIQLKYGTETSDGFLEYVKDGGGEVLREETDETGQARVLVSLFDNLAYYLVVSNSTPDPGTTDRYTRYALGLTKELATSNLSLKQMTGWTFGVNEYNPVVET